jgi:hypothetical protein
MTDLIQRQIDLISTPDGGGDWMASLLRNRPLLLGIARLLAFVGKIWPKPIVFRSKIIVTKHAQIIEALGRDTDFLASQSYQEAIARTNGPFVLAMDRGPQLSHESKALYSALAKFDIHALAERASTEADRLLKESDGKLDAVQDYISTTYSWKPRNRQQLKSEQLRRASC